MYLRLEITTPLNNKIINTVKLAPVREEAGVWMTEPKKRNIDIDVKCSAASRINWWRNLITWKLSVFKLVAYSTLAYSSDSHLQNSGLYPIT